MGFPGLGLSGSDDGLEWSIASVSQELSSLPQPSPPPAGGPAARVEPGFGGWVFRACRRGSAR
jgi:hypothetical protein